MYVCMYFHIIQRGFEVFKIQSIKLLCALPLWEELFSEPSQKSEKELLAEHL